MSPSPLRILTAVPVCDGHDSAINTINIELVKAGIEVIYLGYHRTARDIVRAAIQECSSCSRRTALLTSVFSVAVAARSPKQTPRR